MMFHHRFVRFREELWTNVPSDHLHSIESPQLPWLDTRSGPLLPHIFRLLQHTEFYSCPHVTCFASIVDLAGQIATMDPVSVHQRMRTGHEARLEASAKAIKQAAARIAIT